MEYILILVLHLSNGGVDEIPHAAPLSWEECVKLGNYYQRDERDDLTSYYCEPIVEQTTNEEPEL